MLDSLSVAKTGWLVQLPGPDSKFIDDHPQLLLDQPTIIHQVYIYRGFQSHGGTPSYHQFIDGIFHEINQPAVGNPLVMENPMSLHV